MDDKPREVEDSWSSWEFPVLRGLALCEQDNQTSDMISMPDVAELVHAAPDDVWKVGRALSRLESEGLIVTTGATFGSPWPRLVLRSELGDHLRNDVRTFVGEDVCCLTQSAGLRWLIDFDPFRCLAEALDKLLLKRLGRRPRPCSSESSRCQVHLGPLDRRSDLDGTSTLQQAPETDGCVGSHRRSDPGIQPKRASTTFTSVEWPSVSRGVIWPEADSAEDSWTGAK
jgi:hypothetical protein